MSLSILKELDHPIRPFKDAKGAVLDGAYRGTIAVEEHPESSYLELVSRELKDGASSRSSNPGFLVGAMIGIRAGMLDLDVEREDDSGFQVTGPEMGMIRDAKSLGVYVARQHSELSIAETLRIGFEQVQANRIVLHEPQVVAGIGLAIGVRHFELSPREGLPV